MKRIRLIDAVLVAVVATIAIGLVLRAWRPDAISGMLTDLSRREPVTVFVAIPNPWRQEPLKSLPRRGDHEDGEGGRDRAELVGVYGDSGYPVAVLHVTAREDAARRLWFNYAQLLPGSNFAFRPGRYNLEGIVLSVAAGFHENKSDSGSNAGMTPSSHVPDKPVEP